jgi:hypothetical protein
MTDMMAEVFGRWISTGSQRRRWAVRLTWAGGALALTAAVARPIAAADSCDPLVAAMMKQLATPTHVYVTETAAYRQNQATRSESIYAAGGAIFVLTAGKWTRSKMTVKELKAMAEENLRSTKPTCRYLRDEAVEGEPSAVFSEQTVMPEAKMAATVWVSKQRGLLLREEVDMDVGGTMGKSHIATRFSYANVAPPPGVH